jgi:hypothetical protein
MAEFTLIHLSTALDTRFFNAVKNWIGPMNDCLVAAFYGFGGDTFFLVQTENPAGSLAQRTD